MKGYSSQSVCSAYRQAPRSVPKTLAIAMLYDEVIKLLGEGSTAFESGEFEVHYDTMQKAVKIIHALDAMLDFEQGKEVAVSLRRYYLSISAQIIRATARRDAPELCIQIQKQLAVMRDSWREISKNENDKAFQEGTVQSAGGPIRDARV
ncbi:flagellar protein FliS [Kiloniella sp.]|uniref:flagellar export chaperone FliS n=1 Tax=Kiloniella sp. TaxID=1938587 RepID=UPI003B025AA9